MFGKKQEPEINVEALFSQLSRFCQRQTIPRGYDNPCQVCVEEGKPLCISYLLTQFVGQKQLIDRQGLEKQELAKQIQDKQQELDEMDQEAHKQITEVNNEIEQLNQEITQLKESIPKSEQLLKTINSNFNEKIKELEKKMDENNENLSGDVKRLDESLIGVITPLKNLHDNIEIWNDDTQSYLGSIDDHLTKLTGDYTKLKEATWMFNHKCLRCGKEWSSVKENPLKCPDCQNKKWNIAPEGEDEDE